MVLLNSKRNAFFLLSVMFLISCKQDKIEPISPPLKPDLSKSVQSKAWRIDSLKKMLEKEHHTILSQTVHADSSSITFQVSKMINGSKEYGVYEPGNLDDMQPYADLYIGNVIDGRTFLSDGKFARPAMTPGAAIEQEVSIVGGNGTVLKKDKLPELRNSSVKVFESQATGSIGESKINQNQSPPTVKIGNFKKYNDIKNAVFYNHSNLQISFVPGFDRFSYKSDDDLITKPTGSYIFFRQNYYAVNIEASKRNWRLYTKDYNDSIYATKDPVYINSVTYGRYGFLTVESDVSETQINAILNKAVNDFTSLNENEKNVLAQSSVKCFFFGLPDAWRSHPLLENSLGRAQLFAQILKDTKYRYRPYGDAPIFYQLNTVKENDIYQNFNKQQKLTFDL